MSAKKDTVPAPPSGGAAWKRAAGLVQIVVGMTPVERAYLRAAAGLSVESLQEYARRVLTDHAAGVIPNERKKEIRKKVENTLDTSD